MLKKWIWILVALPVTMGCIWGIYELYNYYFPNVIISYKVADEEDFHVSLPSYGIEAKSHFGYAPRYHEEIKEWWLATNEIEVWLATDFEKPYNVSSNVFIEDGKTIIQYSGTAALPDGEIVDIDKRIELNFIVSDNIPQVKAGRI